MPLPRGCSKTAAKAELKNRALEDIRHYCMGKPETKKRKYFWECDDSNRDAIDAFLALADAVGNYQKEVRLYFIRAKKSLYRWVTRDVWQDEVYNHRLSNSLLEARLLRYKIVKQPGKAKVMRVVDIESIAEVVETEEAIISYKFEDEVTQKDY